MSREVLSAVGVHQLLWICLSVSLWHGMNGQQRFLIEPQDQDAIRGSTAILKCKVASKIGMLQWTKDSFALGVEQNLPGFPRYQMIGGENIVGSQTISESNLKITNVNISDDAEYQCQVGATETVQGIRSRTARLNILLPPDRPLIEGGLRKLRVVAGRLSNISCRANNGKPAATILWFLRSHRLTDMIYSRSIPKPNDKRVDSVGIVSINATKEDGGHRIECRASNDAMENFYTVSATLDVQYPPDIKMLINISRPIREYDNLRFDCRGTGNPSYITWRWLKDGRVLLGETSSTLDIPSISYTEHQKKITCVGSNSVGSTSHDYILNVQFGPQFDERTSHTAVSVNLDQKAVLHCHATGNPTPSIIWRKKGSHLPQGSSPTLTIPHVQEGNLGIYICTANVHGFSSVSREIYLLKNAAPTIMSETKQYAVEGDQGVVECLAMSVPKPDTILWMQSGRVIDFGKKKWEHFTSKEEDLPYGRKSLLYISPVTGADFTDYNCSVINNYGKDVITINLIQKAVPPLPIIIGGAVGGLAVLFIIILACVLYHRYKTAETGSVLGSYTDTDSSTDKKREKSDSPSTLMDQWRQDYNKDVNRYSADYDEDPKGNNNQYRVIEPFNGSVYRDTSQMFDPEYMSRTDENGSDRYGPTYSGQYPLSSFRGDYVDPRLPPACLSTTKLATNV